MKYRKLGRTGWNVSEISFGAWAIGGTWGKVNDNDSISALHRALDMGVNFFDTADVYGDGRSERLLAKFLPPKRLHIIHRLGSFVQSPFRCRIVLSFYRYI